MTDHTTAVDDLYDVIGPGKLPYCDVLGQLRELVEANSGKLNLLFNYLSHPGNVRKFRVNPFELLPAYEALGDIEDMENEVRAGMKALGRALDHAAKINVPELPGVTACSGDNSGSMNQLINERGKFRLRDVSAIFQAITFKRNTEKDPAVLHTRSDKLPLRSSEVLNTLFAEKLAFATLSPERDVFTLAKQMTGVDCGEGTNAHLVFNFLRQKQKSVDRIIILTDSHFSLSAVLMAAEYDQQKFVRAVLDYRREINPDTWVHLWNLSQYDKFNSRCDKDLRYNYVSGFHEDIFNRILQAEQKVEPMENLKL